MQDISDLTTRDEERAELSTVTLALAKYPRLVALAQYLGEMTFQGKSHEVNEYNIATEVFGRSKTVFNAGEDSIVRVETHRLRKKLKEYYVSRGKDHTVQMSIPSGTYIPVFLHVDREVPAETLAETLQDAPDACPVPSIEPQLSKDVLPPGGRVVVTGQLPLFLKRRWQFLLLAVVLVLAVLGIYRGFHAAASTKSFSAQPSLSQPPSAGQSLLAGSGAPPIRLIAGYSGSPQIDSSGAVWKADQYFHGGTTWVRPLGPIAGTSDPMLFRQWRTGDFTYDIPAPAGVYELHLYFVASERDGDEFATFTVTVNGANALWGFDVKTDALGENVADERIFRDVSPAKDGIIHLGFVSQRGVPVLNALELLPGIAHKQLPIRLVTQLTPYTDHEGNLWHSDTFYRNGKMSVQPRQVEGSPDTGLYAAERYGNFTYTLPVDPRDRYTLILHFAEFYFGPTASGAGGAGDRVFRVLCNGTTLEDSLDVFKAAGSLHPLIRTYSHLKPTAQGKLNLTFEPVVNYATVTAIEVLDETQ